MSPRTTVLALALALPLVGALTTCKRHLAPPVQEVWDEEPVPDQAEAIGNLAPPWSAPVRGQLDNGLLTFWLHEADTAALHVRVLVPTTAHADPPSPEAARLFIDWQMSLRGQNHQQTNQFLFYGSVRKDAPPMPNGKRLADYKLLSPTNEMDKFVASRDAFNKEWNAMLGL